MEELDLGTAYGLRTLADRVSEALDNHALKNADDSFRSHLGASVIGDPCARKLFYLFRWVKREKHSARTLRILATGKEEEKKMRQLLRECGAIFEDNDDDSQIRVSDVSGHFGGSLDGVFTWPQLGITVPMLLEVKTSKTGKPFNELSEKGVMNAKRQHYIQQCIYGYKRNIRYACYITINKDNSDIFVEIVELDYSEAKEAIEKGQFVILSNAPPMRVSENPSYWLCKWCNYNDICHFEEPVENLNCRNCKHSQPVENAQWKCNHWNAIIPNEAAILAACPSYESII